MNNKSKELGNFISNLTELWVSWLSNNKKCYDVSLSDLERRISAEICENLITKRYEVVEMINKWFDEQITN